MPADETMESSVELESLSDVETKLVKCSLRLEDGTDKEFLMSSNLQLLDAILGEMPLESLPHINLRCQIGCLCLLSLLRRGELALIHKVEQHLIRCLNVPNPSGLFSHVSHTDLLNFAVSHCTEGGDKERSVLAACVEAVMKDHSFLKNESAGPSAVQYAKELVRSMRQDIKVDSVRMWMAALLVGNTQRYMSYHIPEIKEAALQVFFCLAKFVLRHGFAWLEKSSIQCEGSKQDKMSSLEGKISVKLKKKRKRESMSESREVSISDTESDNSWCSLLSLMTEVLSLWSVDAVEDSVNQALVEVSRELRCRVMDRLKSGSSSNLSKISELQFISSCCQCHLKCSQSSSSCPPSSPSSGPLYGGVTFSLFTSEDLAQLWLDLSSLATAGFSARMATDTSPSVIRDCMEFEKLDLPPTVLSSFVDGLTSVLEASNPTLFTSLLESMLRIMNPSSISVSSSTDTVSGFLLMLAVWRRLVNSQSMPQVLVQIWFKHMYQFLAVFLAVLQHAESFKSRMTPQIEGHATEDHQNGTETTGLSHFILEVISDFLYLGKRHVTARMALLCMQGAMTFTLTSPSELETCHRLLNGLLVYHTNEALTAVPSVIHIINKLLSACIQWGNEEVIVKDPQLLGPVVKSAHLVTRVLLLLSTSSFKSDLAKVAHNVIGEYVVESQKDTVHTEVKRELLRGLYKLMSVSDKYRLASLHTSLPAGTKDTFKFLHQEYCKYHQYSGKA